jgi:hypothetical protein
MKKQDKLRIVTTIKKCVWNFDEDLGRIILSSSKTSIVLQTPLGTGTFYEGLVFCVVL